MYMHICILDIYIHIHKYINLHIYKSVYLYIHILMNPYAPTYK